jgi:hypothetical protein
MLTGKKWQVRIIIAPLPGSQAKTWNQYASRIKTTNKKMRIQMMKKIY